MLNNSKRLGSHWIADASGCNPGAMDQATLAEALRSVPLRLGLTLVGEPVTNTHSDGSVAGIVLIAESHMSLHAFPDQRMLHVDLFSCSAFDVSEARLLLEHIFAIQDWEETLLNRGY